jgi:hypothetical protein
MNAKIGDRVSVDAKKVGQPRRTGVIEKVTEGLSGIRYQVAWDDGHTSVLAPGAGNLTVEGRGNGKAGRAGAKRKRKPTAGKKPAARARAKPKAKRRRR